MSLQKKLLALVIIPIIFCSGIAIIISTVKIKNQGIQDLEDKSNAILSINIDQFLKYHEDGGEIEVQNYEQLSKGTLSDSIQNQFIFRISSTDPINPDHSATEQEKIFIDRFIHENVKEIAYEDKENNWFWVMRPVYMDEARGCLDCHEVEKNNQSLSMNQAINSDFRGMFMVISNMENVQEQVKSSIFQISFWSILIVLLSIGIGYFVIRIIITSIKKIISVSQKVSEGDLKQQVEIKTHDELEELGSYINIMIGSLNNIISSVKETAEDMAKSNKELTDNSRIINTGTQNQAAQFEELSSAVRSTSENTLSATDFINKSVKNADVAEEKMTLLVDAINQIETSSEKINKSVEVISDISAKINLLALNAAIEAARAGSHGKGFAVVAAEVKKLSDVTSESTKDIHKVTSDSTMQVTEGVKVAADAGKKIKEITNAINEIADSLKEILGATQEQSSVMENNNKIINTNASVAEKLNETAISLDKKANKLLELTERFKLKKSEI